MTLLKSALVYKLVYKSSIVSPRLSLRLDFPCKSYYFLSRGGGTRTHTVRILSPKRVRSMVYR